MTARIAAAQPPFAPEIKTALDRIMPPGVAPLVLFTTLARNPRVFARFMAGGLLDKGSISLREREIMIDRTTARCGSEYEWGVHVRFFAQQAGLTEEQVSTLLTRITEHFPNARIALDTFPRRTLDQQRKLAVRRGIPARFSWACDDPRSLERLGLRVVESTGLARLPGPVRRDLPARYRFLLPWAEPILGQAMRVTLFQA